MRREISRTGFVLPVTGKTISFAFRNFCAKVVLYETPELEILPKRQGWLRIYVGQRGGSAIGCSVSNGSVPAMPKSIEDSPWLVQQALHKLNPAYLYF